MRKNNSDSINSSKIAQPKTRWRRKWSVRSVWRAASRVGIKMGAPYDPIKPLGRNQGHCSTMDHLHTAMIGGHILRFCQPSKMVRASKGSKRVCGRWDDVNKLTAAKHCLMLLQPWSGATLLKQKIYVVLLPTSSRFATSPASSEVAGMWGW